MNEEQTEELSTGRSEATVEAGPPAPEESGRAAVTAEEVGPGQSGGPSEGGTPARRRRRRRRRGRGGSRGAGSTGAQRSEDEEDEGPSSLAQAVLESEEPPALTEVEAVPLGQAGAGEVAGAEAGEPAQAGAGEAAEAGQGETSETGTGTRRRRRRRRRRKRAAATAAEGSERAEVPEGPEAGEGAPRGPEVEAAPAPEADEPSEAPSRRGRRRGSRVAAEAPPEEEAPPTRTRKQPRRARRREALPEVERVTDKVMLITEVGERDEIAVLEDRTLVEHYITRAGARSMVGNIYLGKVQNVLPGMEAAFVDVGRGRNAILYAGEVSYDEEVDGQVPKRIEQVLRAGQNVVVQVTKDPMGGKGARLTQQVSLPGRYVVLVPNSQVFGISRRLPDRERARLRDILKKIRPAEHGLIVRTAAEGASASDLEADLARLTEEWSRIEKSARKGKAPRVLYEEPELTVRVVRDLFTAGEFREIVTDSVPVYDQVVAYLKAVAPDLVSRVRLHDGKLPLLEEYRVTEQIQKALERKVWLPSGGYLVFDRTEAMTVIDVNTGKHVGKANLEETVTKTNLEAAEEIARQLRLRDIGGIIIIDFIDMMLEKNREKVIQTLKNAMARDKTRSQVFDIGPLGLLEVTRKRVSAGLLESFSETCPTCEGRGVVLTYRP